MAAGGINVDSVAIDKLRHELIGLGAKGFLLGGVQAPSKRGCRLA